ncbi:MAG TPA: hypothetical protein ENI58_05355 [Nitrospirae bacterium]|nr:hypothetical protein [Nitrospirota bacterium]
MVSSDRLAPAEKGEISVTLRTDRKKGFIASTVQVRTNDPLRPLVILNLKANVIDSFHGKNLETKEIFRSPCRKCHVDRGRGQLGANLFRPDCIMCHMRGMSASSIALLRKLPDRRVLAAIEKGIPDTMMPGFSWKVGGPLTESQIRSLVTYIKGK